MITETNRLIEVLNPVGICRTRAMPVAPRPRDLNGKVLGLLDNGKLNADALVAAVGEMLGAEYRLADVVRFTKAKTARGVAGPVPDWMLDDIVKRCGAIVNAIGD